ncbi:helix-turn-helix transcriptional regulator [Prescottella equi]|uniref:Helix-turn-helix domain-containing protein n=1 Tax=Rhodococcus hoagii TaxID=43767 RepID=A0AAP2AN26_RHOHA|nr:helix-turn-helix domain-containing protein [Prescottella equi]ERN43617.1 hypothetical protein H849_24087 [Prescottella equi NBRC 101255 = C 7]MBM4627719.1 helix-turn-helix domain-containing protein [Prescottella equi]QPQ78646.1 helix-turn-helix domain-containing protein [Prescottella equi]SUE02155.1 Uncharacterised protein [Prescottella equi]SUE21187.1 Uncharacterised protein [Prescottella equi]
MSSVNVRTERLTTKQVHERYPFIPEATLRYWRHTGVGPESAKIGGRVVYRVDRLEEWLAAQEESSKRGGVQ